MKIFLSLKSWSRTVHDEEQHDHHHHEEEQDRNIDGGDASTPLTVWRKSLLMNCNGFQVIDSHGNLIYRVDNYIGHPDEIILMDGSGKSVLSMHRRKKLGMVVDSWFVYEGEVGENYYSSKTTSNRPIFLIKKNANLFNSNKHELAYIYRNNKSDKGYVYVIQGSYTHRSCKVLDESMKVVAEIRRKEALIGGVSYGVDVFQLIVKPGFDPGFAMALILLLDQMFS
ncbi:hypothetical protein UlMin_002033 [Ulmus minor]